MSLSPFVLESLASRIAPRLSENGTLVDLAAGDGALVARVARSRPQAVFMGYERDRALVAGARDRELEHATFALFDLALDRPPPARGRVDVVVSPFVLGAQPDDATLFTHLRRLLRDGGLLVCVERDEATLARANEILVRRGFAIEAIERLDADVIVGLATPDSARAQTAGIRGWD